MKNLAPMRSFDDIRTENLINRWKHRVDVELPNLPKDMAYKIRNMQKTFWAIKNLEKKIAERKNWDLTGKRPDWQYMDNDRLMLKNLKEDLATWTAEMDILDQGSS